MRRFWLKVGLAVAAVFSIGLSAGCASAQGAIQQSGPVVPFHTPAWFSNGVLGDGGTPQSPFLSSLGLFNGTNCPFGISSQTGPGVSLTPYSQFSICQTGAATTFNFLGQNGQATPSVFFNIGGVSYPFPSGQQASAVSNIAALRALTTVPAPAVSVQGFTTATDGGGGLFNYVSTDTTSADNGCTIFVDAGNHRWYRAYSGGVSISWCGAVGDGTTDNQPYIQAAVNVAGAATGTGSTTGQYVMIPASTSGFKVNSTVTLPNNVVLAGYGSASNLIAGSSSISPLIKLNGNSTGVTNMNINMEGFGQGTGTAILFANKNNQFVSNIILSGPCIGIDVNGTSPNVRDTVINDVNGSQCIGIRVGNLTLDGGTIDTRLINVTIGGSHSTPAFADVYIEDSGGLISYGGDWLFAQNGLFVGPGAGQYVVSTYISNEYVADSNTNVGIIIEPQASSGIVQIFDCTQCHVATTGAAGVLISTALGGSVVGVHFVNLKDTYAGHDGVDIAGGSDITISDSHICASGQAAAGAYIGVDIFNAVQNVQLTGNEIGGNCDGFNGSLLYGIGLGGSNFNLTFVGNDLTQGNVNPWGGTAPSLQSIVEAHNNGLHNTNTVPTVTSCGTGGNAASGSTDQRGVIDVGTSGGTITSCTVTFAQTYMLIPTVTFQTNIPIYTTSVTRNGFAFTTTYSGGLANVAVTYAVTP